MHPARENPGRAAFIRQEKVIANLAIFTFCNSLKKVFAGIGRPDARLHDLRHTAATVAIASGADYAARTVATPGYSEHGDAVSERAAGGLML